MSLLEICLSLGGIGAFLGGITALIRHHKSDRQMPLIQIVESSVHIDNLLKDRQSGEYSRVEKIVQNVERSPKASFVEKTTVDAYRLQQIGRIDEARQKWRALADYAERKDNNLAKRAGVSIGYLLPEGEQALASHSTDTNLKPDDGEAHMYRGLGEFAGEGIVVGAVLRYFNGPKFHTFSTAQEHNIGSGLHRVDVALLNEKGHPAAIAECKRIGYVGKGGVTQLTEYCRRSDTQFGLFAADIDPSKWTFLKILGNKIAEIDRSEFEMEIVKFGSP